MENRELKFRAWCLTDEGDKMLMLDRATYDNGLCFETTEHVDLYHNIMQYTGLKDKNGKEIYERDIVRGGAWPDDKDISKIIYRGNGFEVEAEYFGYEGEGMWDWESIEIIGNIYENPELL